MLTKNTVTCKTKKEEVWGSKKEQKQRTHRIDDSVQLVVVSKFKIFPNKKQAITRPILLWNINEWPAPTPIVKFRELVLADLLECSANDVDLLEYWGMA